MPKVICLSYACLFTRFLSTALFTKLLLFMYVFTGSFCDIKSKMIAYYYVCVLYVHATFYFVYISPKYYL